MITENCTYSVPLNGQGSTPAEGDTWQFSVSQCSSVGTSTTQVDFAHFDYAVGFVITFVSMIFIVWLFKRS